MEPPKSVRPARLRARLAALAASTLVALLAFEVGFRVLAHRENQKDLHVALRTEHDVPEGGVATWRQVFRLVGDGGIVYALKPEIRDARLNMGGERTAVSTNSSGFRSREISRAKPPGTVRIVGIGDSVMFGYGVLQEQAYLSLLEQLLNEHYPDRRWEIVNTAVPGYNTRQEVDTLRFGALEFEPDLVILGCVPNDYSPPAYWVEQQDVFALGRSFLLDFFRERGARRGALGGDGDMGGEPAADGRKTVDHLAYLREQGRPGVWSAIRDLAELSREKGFRVLAFSYRATVETDEILKMSSSVGFHTARWEDMVNPYFAEHGITNYRQSELVVGEHDLHPTAPHHRLLALGLLEALESQGLVDALLR